MSALAGIFVEAGHEVSGSDTAFDPPIGPSLRSLGIRCAKGWNADHLEGEPDLVVVGNVCRKDNPEAKAAIERGLRVVSMPQALREHVLDSRRPFVVAGTHGKTTTSTLLSYLLRTVGIDAGFFIGGIPLNLERSSKLGAPGAPFVIEGDEYDSAFFDKVPKFWGYAPRAAVLSSVEYDHIDIYPNEEAYFQAFEHFVGLIPEDGWLFAWAGDPRVRQVTAKARCRLRFYALDEDDCGGLSPMWLGSRAPGGALDIFGGGSSCGRAQLPLFGKHNARNTLAALAMASEAAGAPLERLISALPGFAGSKRRQELVGIANGVHVFDDFAHHPTAVRETLDGIAERFPQGKLIAVFEPRSATASRQLHQKSYTQSFGAADVCVLAPVGRPEIGDSERLDTSMIARALRGQGKTAHACDSIAETVETAAAHAEAGDVVVVMSNGRFGDAPDRILASLALL